MIFITRRMCHIQSINRKALKGGIRITFTNDRSILNVNEQSIRSMKYECVWKLLWILESPLSLGIVLLLSRQLHEEKSPTAV